MTLKAIRRVLELESRVRELEQRLTEIEAQRDALRAAVAQRDAQLGQLTSEPE
jgi:phage shock protein A